MSSYLSKLIVFSVECFIFKKERSWNPPFICAFIVCPGPWTNTYDLWGWPFHRYSASFPELWLVTWSFLRKDSKEFQPWDWLRTLSFGSNSLELFFCCNGKRKNPRVLSEALWGLERFQTYVCVCVWPVKTDTGWDARAAESALPSRIQSSFEKLQNQIKIRKMANWWPYWLHTSCHFSGNKFCKTETAAITPFYSKLTVFINGKSKKNKKTNVDGI